jgi:ATPase family associated with various cellular activities (AAA)
MRPVDFKTVLKSFIKGDIRRALHVMSSPGLGKTQIAGQVAKELGIDFRDLHAPLLQPEDYGFPVISADKKDVHFIVSKSKFPIEGSDCGEAGILLIDELGQADNNAQKILANLIQERQIHGHRIKDKWRIVTTGNRSTDRAGSNRLLSHLTNRLTVVELEPSLDDWTNWAIDSGISPEVIAFVRFRPDLLNTFDPQKDINATPRAWSEGVSPVLSLGLAELEFEVFKGAVGEGPAGEFLAFLKIFRNLPSPDAILLDPTKSVVPKDPATLYALVGALVHRTTKDNFGRVMAYIERLPGEFGVLFVKLALKRSPDVAVTAEFVKWAAGPSGKLLT